MVRGEWSRRKTKKVVTLAVSFIMGVPLYTQGQKQSAVLLFMIGVIAVLTEDDWRHWVIEWLKSGLRSESNRVNNRSEGDYHNAATGNVNSNITNVMNVYPNGDSLKKKKKS